MSLLVSRSSSGITPTQLLGERTARRIGGGRVTRNQALMNSATWACLRLRADLISTMPIDIFRRVGGVQYEVSKPPVFVKPGGKRMRWMEWMYCTQFDLDSVGNTFGIIRAVDGLGLPALIELVAATSVTMRCKDGVRTYLVGTVEYAEHEIWHERQFPVSGLPMGLSPIAHAAMSLQSALSAQQFAHDWFTNSTVPGGHLKNTARTLNRRQSAKAKASFKASVAAGDVWVSGSDWEYSMLASKASESQFLETQRQTVSDVCRFLGVPGDMIDAETSSGSITYANVTQRNLQLLTMNIGPAVARREEAFTAELLPNPRYAKLNTNALQRMDWKGRLEGYQIGINARILTPTEARELEERAPLTPEDEAEFARLFPTKAPVPVTQGVPA